MCECKVCNKLKVRQDGGKRSGCSGVYKVDDAGRRWNGLTCPDCRVDYVGGRESRSTRHYKKQPRIGDSAPDTFDMGSVNVLYPPKLRACKTCSVLNPNYFECDPCRSSKFESGALEETSFADMAAGRVGSSRAGWLY